MYKLEIKENINHWMRTSQRWLQLKWLVWATCHFFLIIIIIYFFGFLFFGVFFLLLLQKLMPRSHLALPCSHKGFMRPLLILSPLYLWQRTINLLVIVHRIRTEDRKGGRRVTHLLSFSSQSSLCQPGKAAVNMVCTPHTQTHTHKRKDTHIISSTNLSLIKGVWLGILKHASPLFMSCI